MIVYHASLSAKSHGSLNGYDWGYTPFSDTARLRVVVDSTLDSEE